MSMMVCSSSKVSSFLMALAPLPWHVSYEGSCMVVSLHVLSLRSFHRRKWSFGDFVAAEFCSWRVLVSAIFWEVSLGTATYLDNKVRYAGDRHTIRKMTPRSFEWYNGFGCNLDIRREN